MRPAASSTRAISETTPAGDNTSAPPTENTASNRPSRPGPARSASLPGLPVGGSAQKTNNPAVQCVFINWQQSAPAIPPDFTVSLTGLILQPADAFTLLNAGCGGVHACLNQGFRLTSDGSTCSLALKFTGQPTGEGKPARTLD